MIATSEISSLANVAKAIAWRNLFSVNRMSAVSNKSTALRRSAWIALEACAGPSSPPVGRGRFRFFAGHFLIISLIPLIISLIPPISTGRLTRQPPCG